MSEKTQLVQCRGGFVTAQRLPDGRFVVESFLLRLRPAGESEPCSTPVYHLIVDADEVDACVAEFVRDTPEDVADEEATS
jgi:hypothetical protein